MAKQSQEDEIHIAISAKDVERVRQAKDGDIVPVFDPLGNVRIPPENVTMENCSFGLCSSSDCVDVVADAELDQAVAEAYGLTKAKTTHGIRWQDEDNSIRVIPSPCDCEFGDGFSSCEHWSPSTDLNAAFGAAEKVGLFQECGHILGRELAANGGMWFVNHTDDRVAEFSDCSQVGRGATPALAICAAILKLKEKTPAS